MIVALLSLTAFMFLFARECNKDKRKSLKRDLEGDLHMLREFKKFLEHHNLDSSNFDDAIKDLEKRLK